MSPCRFFILEIVTQAFVVIKLRNRKTYIVAHAVGGVENAMNTHIMRSYFPTPLQVGIIHFPTLLQVAVVVVYIMVTG